MTKETRPSSYPLRLPDVLREKLESSAKENNRPLSSEILMRLEYTFDAGMQSRASKEVVELQLLTKEHAKRLAYLEKTISDLMREKLKIINPKSSKI